MQVIPGAKAYPRWCHCVEYRFDSSIWISCKKFYFIEGRRAVISISPSFWQSAQYFFPGYINVYLFTQQFDGFNIITQSRRGISFSSTRCLWICRYFIILLVSQVTSFFPFSPNVLHLSSKDWFSIITKSKKYRRRWKYFCLVIGDLIAMTNSEYGLSSVSVSVSSSIFFTIYYVGTLNKHWYRSGPKGLCIINDSKFGFKLSICPCGRWPTVFCFRQ